MHYYLLHEVTKSEVEAGCPIAIMANNKQEAVEKWRENYWDYDESQVKDILEDYHLNEDAGVVPMADGCFVFVDPETIEEIPKEDFEVLSKYLV